MTIPKKLEALDLNLDQWRQDIQTFVASTNHELHEITDSLSSAMAGGPAVSMPPLSPAPLRAPQTSDSQFLNTQDVNKKADDRIAKLKQQLAAKSKQ